MGKVVKLKLVKNQKYPDVVRTLKSLMDEAKQGYISGVAIAIVRPDAACNTRFSACDNAGGLMGAVNLLQHRLTKQVEDETC